MERQTFDTRSTTITSEVGERPPRARIQPSLFSQNAGYGMDIVLLVPDARSRWLFGWNDNTSLKNSSFSTTCGTQLKGSPKLFEPRGNDCLSMVAVIDTWVYLLEAIPERHMYPHKSVPMSHYTVLGIYSTPFKHDQHKSEHKFIPEALLADPTALDWASQCIAQLHVSLPLDRYAESPKPWLCTQMSQSHVAGR